MKPSRPLTRRAVVSAGAVAAMGAGYWALGRPQAPEPQLPLGATPSSSPPLPPLSAVPSSVPVTKTIPEPVSTDALIAKYAGRVPSQWGVGVTGVPARTESDGVLLTLDLCGGPGGSHLDERLIDLLIDLEVPAGIFVNSRWIDANPGRVEELVDTGLFDLGNHGTSHRPLSVNGRSAYGIPGTADVAEVIDEVLGCQEQLRVLTGVAPRWFRSGTAHYDEVAVEIVGELGEVPVGFSVNADAGATASGAQISAALAGAGPGDILLAHANQPRGSTLGGFAVTLPRMLAQGTSFIRLSDAGLTAAASPMDA